MLFLAAVIGLGAPSDPASAQAEDSVLRAKVMQFLGDFAVGAAAGPIAESDITVDLVDLNNDGAAEALVVLNAEPFCGALGCSSFALDLSGPQAQSVGDFTAVKLEALANRTNGWRDIVLNDRGRFSFQNGKYAFAAPYDPTETQAAIPPAQGACAPVSFASGEASTEIAGIAPREEIVCYSLAAPQGRTVALEVVEGANSIFSVVGLVDAQKRYEFTAAQPSYEIVVGQLMRAAADEPFRIRVTTSGAPGMTDEQAAPADLVAIQRLLNQLGYPAGQADGKMGRKTRGAIESFQRDAGLGVTGQPDAALAAALHRTAEQQRSASAGVTAPTESTSPPSVEVVGERVDAVSLRTDLSCGNRPPETEYATPLQIRDPALRPPPEMFGQFAFNFSNASETIRAGKDDGASWYEAGGGDDLIYVDGPTPQTSIGAGSGADTIIVCTLGSSLTSIVGGSLDAAPDIVVVDESVFANPLPGEPVLRISGIVSMNDRVIVRVPEDVAVSFGHDGYQSHVELRVGRVTVLVDWYLWWGPFNPDSLVVTTTSGRRVAVPALGRPQYYLPEALANSTTVGPAPLTLAGNAPAGPLGSATCPDPSEIVGRSEPLPAVPGDIDHSALEPDDPRSNLLFYGDGNDTIAYVGKGSIGSVNGGTGDDTIYVYQPTSQSKIDGGTGADTIILCTPADDTIELGVLLSPEVGSDVDADTVIVLPEMLDKIPQGFLRPISVGSFTVANDRIILRLPEGTTVSYEDEENGAVSLRIGSLHFTIHRADEWLRQPFDWDSIVLVPAGHSDGGTLTDAAAEPAVEEWQWGPPINFAGAPATMADLNPSCREMLDPSPALVITPALGGLSPEVQAMGNFVYYSHDDDLIRLAHTRDAMNVIAGRGNDAVYMLDIGDGVIVSGNGGADSFAVCSMHAAELIIYLGGGLIPVDRAPDLVVIEPPVFMNIPDGIQRVITISDFLSVNDRLELRVPAGMEVRTRRGGSYSLLELEIGQVLVNVDRAFHGPDGVPFDPSSIVIVEATPQ